MQAIEIARRMAELGNPEDACQAFILALHQGGLSPAEELEAALYILQSGGDYRVAYTCFQRLYARGEFRAECLDILTQAFYAPNEKELRNAYERNCKLLKRYPYLFRKDFLPFEQLSIRFYPFDDNGYTPFYVEEGRFGDYINFNHPVISRNFFKDLDNPILADDVYSQYELEYLWDNVRKSEYVAKENHIYLHYRDWGEFCAHLQVLNLRPLLKEEKIIFLIGDEIAQYPIDFKERYGVDYSRFPLKPVGVREVTRLVWHTQLSSHNGGDFFNEIFDGHPNLLLHHSLMFDDVVELVEKIGNALPKAHNAAHAATILNDWDPRVAQELYLMRDRTDKDILVSTFLGDSKCTAPLDSASRIAPVLFFQPHFHRLDYSMTTGKRGVTILHSDEYDKMCTSPLFRGFKYIKTFTPMRRFTTSAGAGVRYMHNAEMKQLEQGQGDHKVISDEVMEKVLNRSFMVDWQDRLFKDSVLVRFEDGKLNPKATFTALAAFLDLPYTESMTYCSFRGQRDPESMSGNARGFDPVTVYRTYDEYINDNERCFIECFMRDVYKFYGYDFHYYDGRPMDAAQVDALIDGFTTIDRYMRESIWRDKIQENKAVVKDDPAQKELDQKIWSELVDGIMKSYHENRRQVARTLMGGLYFINRQGQPLHMMPKLELDPALLEQPLYH